MVCGLVRDWKVVNTEVLQKEEKKKTSPVYYTLVCFPIRYTVPHLGGKKSMNLEVQLPNLWFCYGLCEIELQIPALCHTALVMCSAVHGVVMARYVVGVKIVMF